MAYRGEARIGSVYREDVGLTVRPWVHLVSANFSIAVWTLVGWGAYAGIRAGLEYRAIHERFGPFAHRWTVWPLAMAGVALVLWIYAFRDREAGSRVGAAILAGFTGVSLFVDVLTADLYAMPVDWLARGVFGYISCSCLAYALFGR